MRNQILRDLWNTDIFVCARSSRTTALLAPSSPRVEDPALRSADGLVEKPPTKNSFGLPDGVSSNGARRIIAKFGGQTMLAQLLGLRQSTVQHWAQTGCIPGRWHQRIYDLGSERGVAISLHEFAVVSTDVER